MRNQNLADEAVCFVSSLEFLIWEAHRLSLHDVACILRQAKEDIVHLYMDDGEVDYSK